MKTIINDLQNFCVKATPGPWKFSDHKIDETHLYSQVLMQEGGSDLFDDAVGYCFKHDFRFKKADAEFIVAASKYMRRLIAIAEAANKLDLRFHPRCSWPNKCICGVSNMRDKLDELESEE